jgi:two-component system chemotaxis response regulator CheB
MLEKKRIMVVDDSVVARRIIADILNEEEEFEVVGSAANGRIALAKMPFLSPDLVTLDVEMPEMDGLQTLAALRAEYPDVPVIMVSNLTERGAAITVDSLFLGASDYVTKASHSLSPEHAKESLRNQLIPKTKVLLRGLPGARPCRVAKPAARKPIAPGPVSKSIEVVAVGASTGGPNALATLMEAIPADFPVPILIVQHMPANFTRFLADRLDGKCKIRVAEPDNGTRLEPGHVWIAPGNLHMEVSRVGDAVVVQTRGGPLVNSCRPAVDVLFKSVAACYGPRALAVILTGMGQDGLRGCEMIRAAGGQIVAQDQATSVVWGMPGYVAESNLADGVLPIDQIGADFVRRVMGVRR